MQYLAPFRGFDKPRREPVHVPSQGERLRRIIGQLRHLNLSGRWDPEQIVDRRLGIERDLLALARELDA